MAHETPGTCDGGGVNVDLRIDCKAGVVESVYTRRLKRLALKWLAGSNPAARTMRRYFPLGFRSIGSQVVSRPTDRLIPKLCPGNRSGLSGTKT